MLNIFLLFLTNISSLNLSKYIKNDTIAEINRQFSFIGPEIPLFMNPK